MFYPRENTNSSQESGEMVFAATETSEEALECAWCLQDMGIVPTSGSHGIGSFHAQQMVDAAAERRAWRGGRA